MTMRLLPFIWSCGVTWVMWRHLGKEQKSSITVLFYKTSSPKITIIIFCLDLLFEIFSHALAWSCRWPILSSLDRWGMASMILDFPLRCGQPPNCPLNLWQLGHAFCKLKKHTFSRFSCTKCISVIYEMKVLYFSLRNWVPYRKSTEFHIT